MTTAHLYDEVKEKEKCLSNNWSFLGKVLTARNAIARPLKLWLSRRMKGGKNFSPEGH